MESKLFQLICIDSPGRIVMYGFGRVNLSEAPDELLKQVYEAGCPYIVPTEEGRNKLYPSMPSLEIKDTPFVDKPDKPTVVKKTTKRR